MPSIGFLVLQDFNHTNNSSQTPIKGIRSQISFISVIFRLITL